MAKKKAGTKTITKRFTTARIIRVSRIYQIVINGKPKVVPGGAHVFGGQRVTWSNHWRHRIKVTVFDPIMGQPFSMVIDPGDSRDAPGDVNGAMTGTFPYSVVDLVTGNGIPGNSPPEIIIE